MISRRKQVLFFALIASVGVLFADVVFKWVNPNYLLILFWLLFILMIFINPAYSDFNFEIKWLKLGQSIFLTPMWQLKFKNIDEEGTPEFTLRRDGNRESGRYPIQPTPFPYKIHLLDEFSLRGTKVDLLIISLKEVFYGNSCEQIPYGGVGIMVHFITKDRQVVFEVIKRKRLIPWYGIFFPKKYLTPLENYLRTQASG